MSISRFARVIANDAQFTELNADLADFSDVSIVNLSTTGSLNAPNIEASVSFATPSADIEDLRVSGTLTAASTTIPTLSATYLNAVFGNITSLTCEAIDAGAGTIQTTGDVVARNVSATAVLNAPTVVASTSFATPSADIEDLRVSNSLSVPSITAPTINTTNLNATFGNITSLTCEAVDAGAGTIQTTGDVVGANISAVTALNAPTVTASASFATPSADIEDLRISNSLTVPSLTVPTINANTGTITNLNCDDLVVTNQIQTANIGVDSLNVTTSLVTPNIQSAASNLGIVAADSVQTTDLVVTGASYLKSTNVDGNIVISGSLSASSFPDPINLGAINATGDITSFGSLTCGNGTFNNVEVAGNVQTNTFLANTVSCNSVSCTAGVTAASATIGGSSGVAMTSTTTSIGRFLTLGQTARSHATSSQTAIGIVCSQGTNAIAGDSGVISDFQAWRMIPITLSATAPATYTRAATLRITGAPVGGTNTTITNPYSILVDAGASKFASLESTSLNAGSGTIQTTGAIVGNSVTSSSALVSTLNATTATLGATSITALTLAASPTVLDYYEEYTWNSRLVDFPSSNATMDFAAKVVKIGKQVTITFPNITITTGSLSGTVQYLESQLSGFALPSRFYPANNLYGPIYSYDNVPVSAGNYDFFSSNGTFRFFKFAFEGSFVGGGGYTILGFSVTYST